MAAAKKRTQSLTRRKAKATPSNAGKTNSAAAKSAKSNPKAAPASKQSPGAQTCYLIDASVYIFRAYFSLPESLRDGAGAPVNALYGYVDFLLRFLQATRPEYCGVYFDESLTTSFRNNFFPEYKANRALPPPELERQLKDCQRITELLGLAQYASPTYEADDLIGATMARLRKSRSAKPWRFVIVSTDKDLTQLLTESDELWNYAKDERLDAKGVRREFGVAPEQIADLLALWGDSVDNVPGVPGVGRKTAAELLQKFGSLEEILRDLKRVAQSKLRGAAGLAEKLSMHAEAARLYRRVTQIECEPGILRVTARDLRWTGASAAELRAFFEDRGFGQKLLARIEALDAPGTKANPPK